ncbi:MAG: TIM-barrel domain-containing protein [Alkalispirochaeta sp.]
MPVVHMPNAGNNPCDPGPNNRVPLYPAPGEIVEVHATLDDDQAPPPLNLVVDGHLRSPIPPERSGTAVVYRIGSFDSGQTVSYILGDEQEFSFEVATVHLVSDNGHGQRSVDAWIEFTNGFSVRRTVVDHGGDAGQTVPEESDIELLEHSQWNPRFRLRIRYRRDADRFFGFGERFNALNQCGKRLDVRVYEEYKEQYTSPRTYMPVPFFLTDAGWGMYIESRRRIVFDLDVAGVGIWALQVPVGRSGETVALHVFRGMPAQMIQQYCGVTGYPTTVPEWVFGPWMSSNEWNSQARIEREVGRTQELGIPATVLVIEAWSDEKNFYIWNDATYTPRPGAERPVLSDFAFPPEGRWPDPKGMIDELHRKGIRVLLWQIPILKHLEQPQTQNRNDLDHMVASGYAVKTDAGTPYRVRPWWFTDGHVIDFTNPEAAAWWMSKRQYLLEELAIDGFKTDGGEHVWGDDVGMSSKVQGDEAANQFPIDYLKTYSDHVREHAGVLFSRAGGPGVQTTPLHWAGDQNSTWAEHQSVLRAVLSAGVSGIPLVGWDIGGFSGPLPSAELYARSTEMACFGTIMQYHSEFNDHRDPPVDRTPWNVAEHTGDDSVVEHFRFFAHLRMRLIPYLRECAEQSSRTGAPLMRPLWYQYPNDSVVWSIEDQYLLGPDLLVAPVMSAGTGVRTVYLPSGEWMDIWTGEKLTPEKSVEVRCPVGLIPVYLRSGHSSALDGVFPLRGGIRKDRE